MSLSGQAVNAVIVLPPGGYLPEKRVISLVESIHCSTVSIVGVVRSDSIAKRLRQLSEKYNNIDVYALPDISDYTVALRKCVGENISGSPNGLTLFVDGRADLSCNAFSCALSTMESCREIGMSVLPVQDGLCDLDALLYMLQKPSSVPLVAIRNRILFSASIDSTLSFMTLSELFLQVAFDSKISIISDAKVEKINLVPGSIEKKYEQQIQDEEIKVLEGYQRRFMTKGVSWMKDADLINEFRNQVEIVRELLGKIQAEGVITSAEEFDNHIFRYCLLSVASGQIQVARDMMAAAFELIGERPALMRLYKQIILNFPLESEKMTDGPKVSVVIPLFNQGHYLEEALMSVVNQTYTNWEACVINDGSTDNSPEVAQRLVEKMDDPRIRLLSHQNRGKGGTRNRGIRETDGKYVVTLDSDDMIAPDYFSIAVELMEKNPLAAWVTPRTLVFGKDNHVAWKEPFDFSRCIVMCPSPSSSLLRRTAIKEAGLYREDLTNREDAEIWLTLVENGWVSVTTDEPLFIYRHACKRPGLKNISNIPSKEEITSLHPWWYRRDLDHKFRETAYTEFPIYRFSPWFINWENIKRVLPYIGNRDAFLKAMAEIKAEYPPVTKPCRWKSEDDDCYLEARQALYGVRSRKA